MDRQSSKKRKKTSFNNHGLIKKKKGYWWHTFLSLFSSVYMCEREPWPRRLSSDCSTISRCTSILQHGISHANATAFHTSTTTRAAVTSTSSADAVLSPNHTSSGQVFQSILREGEPSAPPLPTMQMPMVEVSGPEGPILVHRPWSENDIREAMSHLSQPADSGAKFAKELLTFCKSSIQPRPSSEDCWSSKWVQDIGKRSQAIFLSRMWDEGT